MLIRTLLLVTGLLASTGATIAAGPARYIVRDRSSSRAPLPFSEAVVVGDTVYVAGHIGIDPATDLAARDAEREATLVMDAVAKTLGSAGLTMDDLVSVTVYCSDLALYDTFNRIYAGYFHGHFPARAFVGVATLLRGAHFEVQGIAVRPPVQPQPARPPG